MIGCVAYTYGDLLAAGLWIAFGTWIMFVAIPAIPKRAKTDFDDLLEHLPRGTEPVDDVPPLCIRPSPPFDWSREEGRAETKGTPPDRTSR